MADKDNLTFFIPNNYTDSGKILGLVPLKNLLEAALFSVIPGYFFLSSQICPLAVAIIITIIVNGGIFALCITGINGDTASSFILNVGYFIKTRGKLKMRFRKVGSNARK